MSLISKIKEVVLGLKAGRVTLAYPANPRPVPDRFRGRPIFNGEKCVGCAGCANNCPAREILVLDLCQEVRVVKYLGRRCMYCGKCADVCPEKAITMSRQYQNATPRIEDVRQNLEIWMGTCQRCGRCFKDGKPLEQLMMKGYRFDDLKQDVWIYRSEAYLEKEPTVKDIDIELD
jgi:hydrogenase-4 component H